MGFIYTPNMPVANHFPSDDQGPMNQNSQYLNAFGSRDHQFTGNTAANNFDGIHKQVTLKDQTTPGFTPGGTGVLYGNAANGDTQLFYNNSLGNIQLTTVKTGVPGITVGPPSSGVSFLPGGILIQWGKDTKNTAQMTTFPIAFNATPYSVSLTLASPTSLGNGMLSVGGVSTTTFTVGNLTGVSQSYTYYWIAIGPA